MLFYPVFHATLFILQNKKIHLPLLSKFAYFLVLILGFHLLITFLPYRWLFFKRLFGNTFFVNFNDAIKVTA